MASVSCCMCMLCFHVYASCAEHLYPCLTVACGPSLPAELSGRCGRERLALRATVRLSLGLWRRWEGGTAASIPPRTRTATPCAKHTCCCELCLTVLPTIKAMGTCHRQAEDLESPPSHLVNVYAHSPELTFPPHCPHHLFCATVTRVPAPADFPPPSPPSPPLPPSPPPPAFSCPLPPGWCPDNYNYRLIDCDGDLETDITCEAPDGSTRGVVLSSRVGDASFGTGVLGERRRPMGRHVARCCPQGWVTVRLGLGCWPGGKAAPDGSTRGAALSTMVGVHMACLQGTTGYRRGVQGVRAHGRACTWDQGAVG